MTKVIHLLATGLLLTCAAVAFGQATSSGSMASDTASTTPKKKHHLHVPKIPKGTDTGMSGSGPGVPASANGMATPAPSSAK